MFNKCKIVMVTLDPLVVFGPKKKSMYLKFGTNGAKLCDICGTCNMNMHKKL